MVDYVVIMKNVHALHSPSTTVRVSVSNQPVDQVTAHKAARIHPEVIAPVADHYRVFFSVQPIPEVFPDQDNL